MDDLSGLTGYEVLDLCVERLETIYGRRDAMAWVQADHPSIGTSPLVAIHDGRAGDVLAEIDRLLSAAYI